MLLLGEVLSGSSGLFSQLGPMSDRSGKALQMRSDSEEVLIGTLVLR